MLKTLSILVAGSFMGLLAQIDNGLWEKSAWVIMCVLFLSGLTILWRTNQKLVEQINSNKDEEIKRLRELLDKTGKGDNASK